MGQATNDVDWSRSFEPEAVKVDPLAGPQRQTLGGIFMLVLLTLGVVFFSR